MTWSSSAASASRAPWRVIPWDGATLGGWAQELDGCDAVINLAGRSVNCRYTAANRTAILESRVLSTRAVGQAIAQARRPPRVWLQASTATIYAHRYDAPNDEASGRHRGRTGRAGRLDVQHRRRAGVGARARGGDRPADTQGRPAVRDHAEPRPRAASSTRCSASFDAVSAGPPETGGSSSRGFTATTSFRRSGG